MAQFSISPGVTVQEQDQTLTVPAVPASVGALTGVFKWGPAMQPFMVGSVDQLVSTFGKPTNEFNLETWFSAYNFLSYSSSLYVCRAMDATGMNAVANTGTATAIQVNNSDAYDALQSYPTNVAFMAKYPGVMGNSLRVSVCATSSAYSSATPAPTDANNTIAFSFTSGASSGILTVTNTGSVNANTAAQTDASAVLAAIHLNDWLVVGNTTVGQQYAQVTSVGTPVTTSNGVSTATISLGSTGMTVPEMKAAIATITTDKLFTDKAPRSDETMRQKADDFDPYFIPEIGVDKSGVVLPKGLVTGIALEGELRKLVQVASARSFDDLPIPFRAIATDIGTGDMVVLAQGSVVRAIRASMSVQI